MAKPFSMDYSEDLSKLKGKSYTLKGIGENGKDLRAKFVGIDSERRYQFDITTRDTELESYFTGTPNNGEIE